MRRKATHNMGRQRTWWIVLFLTGMLLALMAGEAYADDNPLSTYQLNNFINQTTDWRELFVTVLWERGKLFALLGLLSVSACRRWIQKAAPVLLVFGLGIYGGVCLGCQELAGLGIFCFSLVPHGPVYLAALYLIVHKKKPIQYSGNRYLLTEIASVFLLVVLILAGCLLEASAGHFLFQQYLTLFFS